MDSLGIFAFPRAKYNPSPSLEHTLVLRRRRRAYKHGLQRDEMLPHTQEGRPYTPPIGHSPSSPSCHPSYIQALLLYIII